MATCSTSTALLTQITRSESLLARDSRPPVCTCRHGPWTIQNVMWQWSLSLDPPSGFAGNSREAPRGQRQLLSMRGDRGSRDNRWLHSAMCKQLQGVVFFILPTFYMHHMHLEACWHSQAAARSSWSFSLFLVSSSCSWSSPMEHRGASLFLTD